MIPKELKTDREGLLYTDDKSILHHYLLLDKRKLDLDNKYFSYGYYSFDSTLDYIIKYCYTILTKEESNRYKEMLHRLIDKQKLVLNTDFPIGYFKDQKKVAGLIIKYYENGVSLDNISDIKLLNAYYLHDEDNLHNLFLLFQDILSNINEMFENDIYYTDINSGNFIITDNKVKIIDFEPSNVKFDNRDHNLQTILRFYRLLMRKILRENGIDAYISETVLSFEEARRYTKKLENKVR